MRTRVPKSRAAVICTIQSGSDVWRLLDEIALLSDKVETHTINASKVRELSESTRRAAEAAAGELTVELIERALILGAGCRLTGAAFRSGSSLPRRAGKIFGRLAEAKLA